MKFIANARLAKRGGLALIGLVWLAWLMRPCSWQQNPFNTLQLNDFSILRFNFAWLWYYFLAQYLILPLMQDLLLKVNPMVYIRRPSRDRLFLTALGWLALFLLLYTGLLAILSSLFNFASSLSTIGKILLPAAFSLFTLSLFLLAISLISRDCGFAWAFGLIWAIIALFSKSNYLLMITNLTSFPYLYEVICCVLLVFIDFALNRRTELR